MYSESNKLFIKYLHLRWFFFLNKCVFRNTEAKNTVYKKWFKLSWLGAVFRAYLPPEADIHEVILFHLV